MKIQIYKPLHKTSMNDRDVSSTFINPEVKNLVLLLRDRGHEIELLSNSDDNYKLSGNPDCKILINGRLYFKGDSLDFKVEEELKKIKEIFNNEVPQYQIVTDWKIYDRNAKNLEGINFKLLTQSFNIPQDIEYEKLFLYNETIKTNNTGKKSKVIYIGNSRGGARDEKIKRFLLSGGVQSDLFGNWDPTEFPNTKGKIPMEETKETISSYKYNVCLTEDLYVEKGHRTPRIWEGILANSLCFLEPDYPTDLILHNFQYVKTGKDLNAKINFLENNPEIYDYLLLNQRSKLIPEFITGDRVYNKIMEALNGTD